VLMAEIKLARTEPKKIKSAAGGRAAVSCRVLAEIPSDKLCLIERSDFGGPSTESSPVANRAVSSVYQRTNEELLLIVGLRRRGRLWGRGRLGRFGLRGRLY
jgi:hypothetical protein